MNTAIPDQHKSFELRRATLADREAIRRVATVTWNVTYSSTVRSTNRERVLAHSYSQAALGRALSRGDKDSWFFVAESSGENPEIIGFAEVVIRPGPDTGAELTRIYILPPYQGLGIGKALVKQVIEVLSPGVPELISPRLWLSVEAHNARAIRFYQGRGFQFHRNFVSNLPGQLLEMQEYFLELT